MSESRSSLYKVFTWVLLAALIGVYALYNWYTGTLNQRLAEQAAAVSETGLKLADTDKQLQGLTQSEQGLRTQLATAEAGLQSTTGQLEEATTQVAALTRQVEQDKQEIAAAAEREKDLHAHLESMGAEHEGARKELVGRMESIHKARADLELAHQASQKRIKDLEGEIAQLNQRIADADVRYAAKAKEQEARLNERVKSYRLALEGSDPERAALVSQLEQQAAAERAALEQAQERHQSDLDAAAQARTAAEADLSARLAEVQQQAEAQAQAAAAAQEAKAAADAALTEARGKAAALTEETQGARDALAALEQKYEQTVAELRAELDQAGQALTTVQAQLSTAVAAATQDRDARDGQAKLAQQRIGELEQDLKTAQSRYEETLTEAQRTLEQARAEAQQQAEQTLAAERAKAEAARAAERDQAAQALDLERQAKAAVVTQVRGLSSRYTQLKAQQTDRGMLVNLGDEQLHFTTGAATLPKGQIASLDRIGALLVEYPSLTARIEGYTDSSGADQTNLTLSQARADAVRAGLIARGVAADRLSAEGFGKQRPLTENTTPAGRRKNRRVEVYLIEPAP